MGRGNNGNVVDVELREALDRDYQLGGEKDEDDDNLKRSQRRFSSVKLRLTDEGAIEDGPEDPAWLIRYG